MPVVSEQHTLPVREARAGDPEAWETLLARYRLPLYAYVYELVRHEQTSLDIVQESFISASRYIGTLRDNDKFGSWLFNIAHQKCAQHWRRRQPDQVPLEPDDPEWADREADPGELLIRKEQEEAFMRFINQLPVPHRSVLLLHYLEEFSLEDIARITGAAPGTVKSRLHYARKALRKLLEQEKI